MDREDCAAAESMAGALADLVHLDEDTRNNGDMSSCKIDFLTALVVSRPCSPPLRRAE